MARSARPRLPDVIVVGSINVDFVIRVPRLPGPGETVTGGTFEQHGGGKGANAAVAAARAGAAVRLIGAVGDDELGNSQLEELAAEGIDITGVVRIPGAHTGVALIVVDLLGENQIAVASGASTELDAVSVARALETVAPAEAAVCLLGFEVPDEALIAAAMWAAARGLRVLLNPAPARPIRDELLALHPIVTPNAAEALSLTGEASEEAAGWALIELTGAPVVVTHGSSGALVVDATGARRLPAFAVEAIDTTGAGDVFNGALAEALSGGRALNDALHRAMAAAALSTTVPGARSAPPSSAVDAFLHST